MAYYEQNRQDRRDKILAIPKLFTKDTNGYSAIIQTLLALALGDE